MSEAGSRQPTYKVLSTRAIVLSAIALCVVGVGIASWLLAAYGKGTEADRARLEAIKTAGTIVVGTGGAAALWLAARRQRTTEIMLVQKDIDQIHQERVATAGEADASERRITELYTKAVEQLGSEKAPVRLGGMYALERLAQNVPDQRQTIVNVLCAYLRMPYIPVSDIDQEMQPDPAVVEKRAQERQVRMTAQRILAAHLRQAEVQEDGKSSFWPNVDLDLTAAVLLAFDFTVCHVRAARFIGTRFLESAKFNGALFCGSARFDEAEFGGLAVFDDARFADDVRFNRAQFADISRFKGACFDRAAKFNRACFADAAMFHNAQFNGAAVFNRVYFRGHAWFNSARFLGKSVFNWSRFNGDARFNVTHFEEASSFFAVTFESRAVFYGARLHSETTFKEAQFKGVLRFEGAEVPVHSGLLQRLPSGHALAPISKTSSAGEWAYIVRLPSGETDDTPQGRVDSDNEQ